MTSVEYTQFRETIRTDHSDLYQYLPDHFDLNQWQEFVVRLLETLDAASNVIKDQEEHITELKEDISYFASEIVDLRDRLDDYED